MKESPERHINPFLSDAENDKVNFTTNIEDGRFEKSLENVPSESLQKAKEVYIDKSVTECQPPEVVTCYEESGFNVVKDICVDEGLSHGETIKCDKEHLHHELSCNPITANGDKHDDMVKDDLDTQLISTPLEDCHKNTCLLSVTKDDKIVESNIDPDNLMQNGEEKLDSSSNSLNDSIDILDTPKNGVDDVDQQLPEAHRAVSEANEPKPTNHTIETPNEIKMEEDNNTSSSDNVKPATGSGPHELPLDTQSAPNRHDMASNNITVAPRGGGESSFSMADPVSGLITYSGPITASGSISHRSDGSNSSVRSFAFPILQNEWNSSPVRMAKVDDTKESRKHRGWRQALMCCTF